MALQLPCSTPMCMCTCARIRVRVRVCANYGSNATNNFMCRKVFTKIEMSACSNTSNRQRLSAGQNGSTHRSLDSWPTIKINEW